MLDQHLTELFDSWQTSRKDVVVKIHLDGEQPSPRIVADQTLDQAILNILNNAADASPDDVDVKALWNSHTLTLEVADRGSGLSPEAMNKHGETIYSSKQDGLGLGLFLTYTTLERLGGKVYLHNREGGGVICQVKLPLDAILITK